MNRGLVLCHNIGRGVVECTRYEGRTATHRGHGHAAHLNIGDVEGFRVHPDDALRINGSAEA